MLRHSVIFVDFCYKIVQKLNCLRLCMRLLVLCRLKTTGRLHFSGLKIRMGDCITIRLGYFCLVALYLMVSVFQLAFVPAVAYL